MSAEKQTGIAFLEEVAKAHLDFSGSAGVPIIRAKSEIAEPYHWSWSNVEELLNKSKQMQLGERRMLRLANPGTPNWKYATHTMSVSVQHILPGELAVPHRHSANAIRFAISGNGAYTTVEHDKCQMEPGDLIITPGWEWHDYGCEGTEPGVWLDALDLPVVQFLDGIGYLKTIAQDVGYEKSHLERLDVEGIGISEQRFKGVGLRPFAKAHATSLRTGLIHYRWQKTLESLEALSAGEGDPFDGFMLEYVNPETGESVYPTFGCFIQMIRAGERTRAHRHTSSAVYYVVSGRGATVVQDRVFRWSKGDLLVVPGSHWHEHSCEGEEPAILFSVQDTPLMKRLGLYREEAYEEDHLATTI